MAQGRPRMMKVRDVAKLYDLSERTVRSWVKAASISFVRLSGGTIRIPVPQERLPLPADWPSSAREDPNMKNDEEP